MHGIRTKGKAKMGAKQITAFLIVVFFHFYHPASLLPLEKNSTSGNMGEREMNEQSRSIQGDGSGIASRSNFASGAGRGGGGASGGGGRPVGGSEEANGGGSTTPSTGAGGAAVIPLYAAGAANGHHNSHHHGAASCNRSCVGFATLCAVIFTSLLVHIYVVLGS